MRTSHGEWWIADFEKDQFNAQILMIWESSRGSRRVGEWVKLIELCEQRAVSIHVVTHHRTYDPAAAIGRGAATGHGVIRL